MLFGTLLVHIWFVLINYEVRTFLGGQWVLRAHLGHVPTLSFIFFFLNSGHALPCGTLIAGYSWLREWDTRKGKKKENEKEMKRSDHLGKLEGIKALRLSITVDRLLLFLFFFFSFLWDWVIIDLLSVVWLRTSCLFLFLHNYSQIPCSYIDFSL